MLVHNEHLLLNIHGVNVEILKPIDYYRLADSKRVHYRHARPPKYLFLFTALTAHCNTDCSRLTTEFRYDEQVVKVDVIIRGYFRIDVDGSCCRLWVYCFYIAPLMSFSSLNTLPFSFCL
jgi:hypothetical protein